MISLFLIIFYIDIASETLKNIYWIRQNLYTCSPARAFTEINVGGGWRNPPHLGTPKRGQNLNFKFKTFGFLDTSKIHMSHTVQLPYKYYFISPSNKTGRKKQQTKFFMFFTRQFQILKV